MRIWIDTEFNGFTGPMISMALVAEDGSEFYEALYCSNPQPWVAQNVIPNLGIIPIAADVFRTKVQKFLNQFDSIHVIADWPEDITNLLKIMVTADGYCFRTPPFTMEILRDIRGISKVPHNALEDARANMLEHLEMELNPKPSFEDSMAAMIKAAFDDES
jgi:hypothetical protein